MTESQIWLEDSGSYTIDAEFGDSTKVNAGTKVTCKILGVIYNGESLIDDSPIPNKTISDSVLNRYDIAEVSVSGITNPTLEMTVLFDVLVDEDLKCATYLEQLKRSKNYIKLHYQATDTTVCSYLLKVLDEGTLQNDTSSHGHHHVRIKSISWSESGSDNYWKLVAKVSMVVTS